MPNTATVPPATMNRTVTIAAIVEAGSFLDDATVNTHVQQRDTHKYTLCVTLLSYVCHWDLMVGETHS